jgi:outer-membrane receptor for ferric coprogen and ferric-rhodotorulic acid
MPIADGSFWGEDMSLSARNSVRCCCLAVAVSLGLAATLPTLAQQTTARYELNLPGQPLRNALIALGKATHLNIAFEPASVAGLSAPVLVGNYTPDEALDQLLKGSGLRARRTEGGSYAVEPASAKHKHQGTQPVTTNDKIHSDTHSKQTSSDGSQTLDTVVVTAHVQGFSATRIPTELKEIPQSVSVIDQQTLQQQNANDLASAFNWAPGISVVQETSMASYFMSRGFSIGTLHVDGGGPMAYAFAVGQNGRVDLSQYDNIELLRGADALFGGTGQPGGSINLTRKRPQAEASTALSASAGSWDNYRVEADINTGSITDDGHLRARLVAVDESQHYFYDTAQRRMNKLYAIAEYDLLPSTQLEAGGSIERTPSFVQFVSGLPRYYDGSDAHLPRSTALTFPWAKSSSTNKEGFLRVEHSFNERWKLKTGVTRTEQDQNSAYPGSLAGIDPVSRTMNPLLMTVNAGPLATRQLTTDITLAGSFDWNGRAQEVGLGFDVTRRSSMTDIGDFPLSGPPIDPFHFDPSLYPAPTSPPWHSLKYTLNAREHGVFASLKLRPLDGWTVTAGARSTSSRLHEVNQDSYESLQFPGESGTGSSSSVITPFLGVVYDISPTYSAYASYADTSQGYSSSLITTSGQILNPPRGTNMELGVKAGWDQGRLNGSLALFDIQQIDVAVRDPAAPFGPPGSNCCFIATTQRSKGVEATLNGQLAPGWQLSAGYTLNINRQGDGGTLSTVTPKHLLKLWTSYRLPGRAAAWDIGGGIVAQTKNYRQDVSCSAFDLAILRCTGLSAPYHAEQGFYAVATLRVGYRVNERWNLALNVDNLFDRRYYQTIGTVKSGNWYGAPRNAMLTVRGEF